jgi:hypothetical protein
MIDADAGIVWVSAPGDYVIFNSNHTPDGTDGASYVVRRHRGCRSAEALPRHGPPRVVVTLLQETANKTLPVLDRRVDLIRRVNV